MEQGARLQFQCSSRPEDVPVSDLIEVHSGDLVGWHKVPHDREDFRIEPDIRDLIFIYDLNYEGCAIEHVSSVPCKNAESGSCSRRTMIVEMTAQMKLLYLLRSSGLCLAYTLNGPRTAEQKKARRERSRSGDMAARAQVRPGPSGFRSSTRPFGELVRTRWCL